MHETWRDRLSEYLDGELMPSNIASGMISVLPMCSAPDSVMAA